MAHHESLTEPQDAPTRDEGFTLIEVVWALFLLGILAMASLGLFIHGMKSIAHVQRQQAAVSLASSAMDMARSVKPGAVNATGTSGLVKGRNQTDATATWNAAKAINASDTSDMTLVWDPELGVVTSDQWVPVTTTAKVDNQTYTIDTLVGKCYRLKAASTTSQDCVAVNPAPSAGTYIEMYRVRVIVRWDESSDASRKFTYRISSLVDPSDDATWNTDIKPFAYDDEVSVDAGSSTFLSIVTNDSVNYNTSGSSSPVKNLTQPSKGSVAVNTALGLNGVVFTAPSDVSGQVTFTYYVQGSDGALSDGPATVTVHILPVPVTDKIYVASGSTTVLNAKMLAGPPADIAVTNISGSRKTTIVPVWSTATDMFSTSVTSAITAARNADAANLAAAGITVLSNGDVKFVAPSTEKDTSFYYYLVDDSVAAGGLRYPSSVAVKVTVTTENSPVAKDITVTYDATASDTSKTIDWRTLTGNATGTKINVTAITGPGTPGSRVKIDGNAALGATGTALTFTTNSVIGNYVISYNVVSPSGQVVSASGKITVIVAPVGLNGPSQAKSGTTGNIRTYTINPDPTGTASDFIPTTGVGLTAVTITGGQCNAVTQPTTAAPLAFTVTFTTSSGTPTCNLTYKVISTGTTTGLVPAVVSQTTYTIVVTR